MPKIILRIVPITWKRNKPTRIGTFPLNIKLKKCLRNFLILKYIFTSVFANENIECIVRHFVSTQSGKVQLPADSITDMSNWDYYYDYFMKLKTAIDDNVNVR